MRLTSYALLSGLLLLMEGLHGQESESNRLARVYHDRATSFYNLPNPTDRTDSLALFYYQRALQYAQPGAANARLLFDCHEKIGICAQTFARQTEALRSYQRAIATCKQYQLSDSLLFIPYLYSGSVHFFSQSYDSTAYFFTQAEAIYNRHRGVPEAQRLFNSLGALYHESGNYQQSINYFQKALQLQGAKPRTDSAAIYSYKSNIATALRNLQQYDSAAVIYKSLLPFVANRNKLYVNLGAVYLQKKQPAEAIKYLTQAESDTSNEVVIRHSLAEAYLQQFRYAEARHSLGQALLLARKQRSRGQKSSRIGLIYKLLGDVERQQGRPARALHFYQRSLIELDLNFYSADPYQNPQDYQQGFNPYLLFESLVAKAECWQALDAQKRTPRYRQAALAAYRAAFRLADYIGKSFDNEEARLFTVQKAYPIHKRVVAYLIQTHEETGNIKYVEEAFRWSEQSKSAVLAIGLKENAAKSVSGIPDSLLSRERSLRFSLSRTLLQLETTVDSVQNKRLTNQLRDTELNLSRLTAQLNNYPDYYRLKFSVDSVSVTGLQQTVLDKQTALVSYFRIDTALFGFVLTREALRYFKVPRPATLDRTLGGLLRSLQTVAPGRAFDGRIYAESLYNKLLRPAEPHLAGIRSLILIPHDELTLLPFEALYDRAYLLERFDITYQYSASFLRSPVPGPPPLDRMLSVAPFDASVPHCAFARLQASAGEIQQLSGHKLTGRQATKANFLRLAGRHPILHLATHAVADNESPTRSFVAFYPTPNQSSRLYAHEIKYGALVHTKLVFLSACETARGKLVRGEGVMSLSRAFSYAGCANLITSLWQAEDNATAYLSRRFYAHLRQGLSFARALRAAKLDLLHDREQVQFHLPQYWSHLVFIGMPAPVEPDWWGLFVTSLGVVAAGFALWHWQKRRRAPKARARAERV